MADDLFIQIVIAIVAVAGLVLSIFNFYLQWRDNKPRIKVTITSCFVTTPGIETSPLLLAFTALNIGKIPVKLSSCGVNLPNGKILHLVGKDQYSINQLPFTLMPGEDFIIYREYETIVQNIRSEGFRGIIKIIAFYRDKIDNKYTSKKTDINVFV
ncbi:MAG: hypothetical protein ABSE74_01190 [Methanoregula sp.]|jgi:hypothetical protein